MITSERELQRTRSGNTVEIKRGDEGRELFATYLRDGEKIALVLYHDNLQAEIAMWVLDGKMPENGTFYKF